MSYKVYIYALMFLLTTFAFTGINFTGFFKIRHEIEAKIFVMLMIMAVSYLSSEFIIGFIKG